MPTDEVEKARAEEYLAELPDDAFADLVARVRPPSSRPDGWTGRAVRDPGEVQRQLEKRFGVKPENGSTGLTEAEKRFGKRGERR